MKNEEKILQVLGQIQGDIKDMKVDIKDLKGDVSILKEDVSILKSDVSILKEDVTILKGDVSILKEDVTVLKGDVSILKEDVTVLKGDVSILKEDVTVLKGDVNILKEGQIETNKHLVILDTKVDAISNKLDDIEALNASRHTEITSNIINLSKDFTIVEAVTGKNMLDIAHLKAAK